MNDLVKKNIEDYMGRPIKPWDELIFRTMGWGYEGKRTIGVQAYELLNYLNEKMEFKPKTNKDELESR